VKRPVLALVALALLAGPLAAVSGAQQRVVPAPAPAAGDAPVSQAVVNVTTTPIYVPAPWEGEDLTFPLLSEAAVVAVHEDDDELKFDLGNELGSFRPAPKGGSAFFGQGRPIFGIAAPPILPSRILRPLGTGDAGDRFLGAPPAIPDNTVIPQIGKTFDDRRQSFAFLDGPPAVTTSGSAGSTQFPMPQTLAADVNGPDVPDNVGTPPTTTTPTTQPPDEPTTPGTRPSTTTTPTTAPPTGTTVPGATTTTRPSTTTTTRPTTTTTRPSTTTTTRPTTTTTTTRPSTTTTTTRPTTTTTTTAPPPVTVPPEPDRPSTSFVLGNQRESASYCLSNAIEDSHDNPGCDRLFDLSDVSPGQPSAVNLTLWNVDPDSDTDAVDLRMYSSGACTSGTDGSPPFGSGNLCDGLQLKVERFATAARTGAPSECLYGCGAAYGGSLNQFATSHTSMSTGVRIGNRFRVNEKAYLVITVLLPDTGNEGSGRGRENKYQSRTATLHMTWRMISA
jgi:hypothetical protein